MAHYFNSNIKQNFCLSQYNNTPCKVERLTLRNIVSMTNNLFAHNIHYLPVFPSESYIEKKKCIVLIEKWSVFFWKITGQYNLKKLTVPHDLEALSLKLHTNGTICTQ